MILIDPTRRRLLPAAIACLALAALPVSAQQSEEEAASPGLWSKFVDPEDGKFDMSEYLLEQFAGFMPVPIIITEPAVDAGLGMAGLFFHKPKDDQMKPDEDGNIILPNISVAGAGLTGNDSWFVGGGHFRNWSRDKYRYRVVGGYADINLDWYPSEDSPLPPIGIGFNVTGALIDQSFYRRIGGSDWLLGGSWRYLRSELSFGDLLPPELFGDDNTVSSVSAIGLYEDLDFQLSPRRGISLELKAEFNREAIGSEFNFEQYSWEYRHYLELGDKWTLAWRFDGATIQGDAPFYLEPFVKIQGIPAMRYRGPTAATAEVRAGYDITPRWTINGFVGGGRAADSLSDLGSVKTQSAVGGGFRYLIARQLGMRVGIDVAEGPEGTYGYLVVGSPW